MISDRKDVRSNFLTIVVQLTIFFYSLSTTQVITTGNSSDLSRKVWVTAYKGDTYGANLRHAFTLNQRITLSYAERSSHTK